MASSNPSKHNNDDFKLGSLFGVKHKVALVTGTCFFQYLQKLDLSQVVDLALA